MESLCLSQWRHTGYKIYSMGLVVARGSQTQYSTTPFMIYGQGHLWVPPGRSETKGDDNSDNAVKTNEK